MFSRHVTKDISAYCHGELSSEASKQFAEHIISCVKCRTRFEEVKRGIKLAEQLPTLSAPDRLWRDLEPLLGTRAETPSVARGSWRVPVAAAAGLLLVASLGIWWLLKESQSPSVSVTFKPAWQVKRLGGTPKIGAEGISSDGQLEIGEWLETDGSSRAQIAVGSIGNVDIDENTRVRLLAAAPTEHRLELARGKMSARIWAPPLLFFVDTPSAVAADLGCAYTLEVDDDGASLLKVTSGWVALQLKDRESLVPAGAACETRPGVGPGTPYFVDSTPAFREELKKIDFSDDATTRSAALTSMLNQTRPRDMLTLWHLLARVDEGDRVRVYEAMASFVPPPNGVTREGVLQLDPAMLESWRHALEITWSSGGKFTKTDTGADSKLKGSPSKLLKEKAPK